MVSDAIRERYLRDPLPIRLGGLAADLVRIASCVDNPKNRDVVTMLLDEGKFFAEWTAPEAPLEIQAALAEVQVLLACWQRRWVVGRPEPLMREQARRWSDHLLELSGLLV